MDKLYHYTQFVSVRTRVEGPVEDIHGNMSGLYGDCTFIRGDVSGLTGDCSTAYGDATSVFGGIADVEYSRYTLKHVCFIAVDVDPS